MIIFLVERSADGKTFEAIAKINGSGNSSSQGILYYSFIDESPRLFLNFYRLTQVDFDGTKSYSKIVNAYVNKGVSIKVSSIERGNLLVTFSDLTDKGFVRIFDAVGKLTYQKKYDGSEQLHVPTTGWSKGVYTIIFNKFVNRFIVQ